VKISLQETAG